MTQLSDILNYFDAPVEQFPDRSTRWLFEDGDNIRGLLEIIDPELEEPVDFSQMTRLGGSFIFDNLRERESDIVVSVPFRRESEADELLIYILIEHQSTIDSTMGFRLLFYMNQLWDYQRREWESEAVPKSRWRLRPILPIVFYTGDRHWNAPLALSAIMDVPDSLRRFVPTFDVLFLNVTEADEGNLTKSDHPLGWLLSVLRKEHAGRETMSDALVKAMSRLNAIDDARAAQRRRAIAYLQMLILHRRPAGEHDELTQLVSQHIQHDSDREELENMTQTMAQRHFEQGHEQGEKRGETRARREAIIKLRRLRFEDVPESVINRIGLIRSFSRLDALFEQALTAESMDEIDLRNHAR